jgi:prepilin-type N-terminal cleavage/methylation domain-containing protein
MIHSQERGFTILEIIVVLAIIGVLAAVVLNGIAESRAQAQDVKRQSDLQQLQLAIRLYQEQNSGAPPLPGCGRGATSSPWASQGTGNGGVCEEYIMDLAPAFIAQLPQDTNMQTVSSETYGYGYRTNGNEIVPGDGWKVVVFGGSEFYKIKTNDDPFARCPAHCATINPFCNPRHGRFERTFAVYNEAGACL